MITKLLAACSEHHEKHLYDSFIFGNSQFYILEKKVWKQIFYYNYPDIEKKVFSRSG